MTGTLLFLFSIFIGIIAANLFGHFQKKYSYGVTGNTLTGVFGSIFLIKLFGRFGFDYCLIIGNGTFHIGLFITNSLISILGGILGLLCIKFFDTKMNNKTPN